MATTARTAFVRGSGVLPLYRSLCDCKRILSKTLDLAISGRPPASYGGRGRGEEIVKRTTRGSASVYMGKGHALAWMPHDCEVKKRAEPAAKCSHA